MNELGDTLFNKTQQRVLGLLYSQPDRSFYTKEILRLTGMGVFTIKRELDRMVASGILTLKKVGNQHHYQANRECPIFADLRNIVLKTFGMTEILRSALAPLDDQIQLAFVYGSLARGADSKKSDVDLMVIAEHELPYSDVMNHLLPLEQSLMRTINPTIYNFAEFETKLKGGNNFLEKTLDRPKLWIKGSEDDIAAIR